MKFKNLFKKTKNEEYELRLKNEFGLSKKGEDWAYYGTGSFDEKIQHELHNKKACLEAINYLRTEMECDLICIVPGKPTIMTFNTKPPYAFATSMSPEESAILIDSLLKKTKLKVADYKNTFMLKLP